MTLIRAFIVSSMLFFSTAAFAEELAPTQQLLQYLKNLKTLQADFIQESYDKNKVLLQKQSGNFKVNESGEFIWNIASPYEQKIISDAKVLKIYDPDLQQITIKSLDKKAQIIPLLLFSGESGDITKQYSISITGKDVFDLSAQDKNSLFEKLQISFINGKPHSLSIEDSLKQKTMVNFEHVIVNQLLKPSLFQFETPSGVDIIDER